MKRELRNHSRLHHGQLNPTPVLEMCQFRSSAPILEPRPSLLARYPVKNSDLPPRPVCPANFPPYHAITMLRPIVLIVLACFAGCAPAVRADRANQADDSLFDPQRHWRVDQIQPGWKGYGLSVFRGSKIERFEVEVISILRNFNPKGDVILIRCSGQNLEHTGPVSGMSGSPIYLTDDAGNTKLAGAFAYGWPLMKDPLAGVQPIEYMLDMPLTPEQKRDISPATQPAVHTGAPGPARSAAPASHGTLRWTMDETYWTGWTAPVDQHPLMTALKRPARSQGDASALALQPLGAPLSHAGLSRSVLDTFGPILQARGFTTLQASGGRNADGAADIRLEPGSVIAVPLLIGDVDLTAIGTTTEVIGDRVFGFGHPFLSEGPVRLPLANGRIHTIVANLMTSFKLGSMGEIRGTLTNDQTFGIAGTLGKAPAMIPIDLRVIYTNGTEDRTYHFEAANHPQFMPLLGAMALMTAVTGQRSLPPDHTLEYDLTLEFEKGHVLHLRNAVPDTYSGSFFFQVGMPMMAAATNPFEPIAVKKMSGEIRVIPQSQAAEIRSVILPKTSYEPGETLRAFVMYRPFRQAEAILPIEFDLPKDLADGQYMLSVSDWQQHLNQEQMSKPFRFVAENVEEVFEVLGDVMGVQQKALYVRLMREADGVAIGRTAMPHLPSSRRQIMLGAGRSNFTPYVSSMVQTLPTDYIMSGSAQFTITIERKQKVAAQRPPASPPAAQPKAEEPARGKPAAQPKAEPAAPAESDAREDGTTGNDPPAGTQ